MVLKLLKKAENETAYLKAGILGFAGSGKTHTAMLMAMGIRERLKSSRPIAFLDTEAGSDFWVERCTAKGIELLRAKTRAFQDLMAIMAEAEANCDVLVIDSISHIWKNFVESYMVKLNRKGRLQFQDWNVIKPEWGRFTDLFLNSRVHIVMCGRAGWEYDYFEDEETKQRELVKTGTKMKVESEMGYEPSLLLEMERVRQKKGKVGQEWLHRCHVLKDRTDTINGKFFDDPDFGVFLPVFERLNIGGAHTGIDVSRSSEDVFDVQGRTEQARREQKKKGLLEEIEGVLIKEFPATTGNDRKAKLEVLDTVFHTVSWTRLSNITIAELEKGLSTILDILNDESSLERLRAGEGLNKQGVTA